MYILLRTETNVFAIIKPTGYTTSEPSQRFVCYDMRLIISGQVFDWCPSMNAFEIQSVLNDNGQTDGLHQVFDTEKEAIEKVSIMYLLDDILNHSACCHLDE